MNETHLKMVQIKILTKIFKTFSGTKKRSVPPTDGPAYWNHVARHMGLKSHYLDPFLGEMKRQAHLSLVQRWGGLPVTGRVLKTDLFEEAMGPDALLTDLPNYGGMILGMDVSAAIAIQARRRDADLHAYYVAADVRRLPFANGTFSLIISTSTLDHFRDPSDLNRSLRQLARVLEPGGQLIVTLDNRQNLLDFLLRFISRMGWLPYYTGRSYKVDELCAELETVGLVVKDTTAILHNPRLMAVVAVSFTNKLRCRVLTTLVHRALVAFQKMGKTRWRYRTGSFVAARAVRPVMCVNGCGTALDPTECVA